jgi:hypothetical protein
VSEVPFATLSDVHLFDCHLVFSRSHPVDEELGVRMHETLLLGVRRNSVLLGFRYRLVS